MLVKSLRNKQNNLIEMVCNLNIAEQPCSKARKASTAETNAKELRTTVKAYLGALTDKQ